MRGSSRSHWIGFLGWLAAVVATAALGALASTDAAAFYAMLDRPAWAPPARVFGPAWSVLYTLMLVAVCIVWRRAPHNRVAFVLFGAQLVANALWSWLFFAWHQGALAAWEVLVLLVLIALTVRAFWRESRLAAALMLPCLLWVSFASALTWSVWQRNPNLL